jgi:predicted DNA-binding antitoxin AbrB/MazE fold protein
MTLTLEAIYENGVLKPRTPLPLADGAAVRLTLATADEDYDPLDAVIGICKGGPKDAAAEHDRYIYGDLRP